jgi:hypothetical protein
MLGPGPQNDLTDLSHSFFLVDSTDVPEYLVSKDVAHPAGVLP